EEASDREHTNDRARCKRSRAKVIRELRVLRFVREVTRREEGEESEREEPDQQRKRSEPRPEEAARHDSVFDADRTRRDRADHDAEPDGRRDAREREDEAPPLLLFVAARVIAPKRERRAAVDDADQEERDGRV